MRCLSRGVPIRYGARMARGFEGTTVIDRPIDEVFAFLADGENDPKFSPRVKEITKTTDGPPRVGTVFRSTVTDAGMTTHREFELTEFEPPTRIRWTERTKNLVSVASGGYDLAPEGEGTRMTIHNNLQARGFGKLIEPIAVRMARKDAPHLAARIKQAIEAS
jgi:uncharacterized protein YndB with AHSA1/START domain